MKTELRNEESVVKQAGANMQRGIETVGGRLYLTDRRLVFESHRFNVRRGATEVELSEVESVEPCWTKLFNLIPLFPNSLCVRTMHGEEHRFVLNDRMGWKESIEAQLP
jgi:hypothetical protein